MRSVTWQTIYKNLQSIVITNLLWLVATLRQHFRLTSQARYSARRLPTHFMLIAGGTLGACVVTSTGCSPTFDWREMPYTQTLPNVAHPFRYAVQFPARPAEGTRPLPLQLIQPNTAANQQTNAQQPGQNALVNFTLDFTLRSATVEQINFAVGHAVLPASIQQSTQSALQHEQIIRAALASMLQRIQAPANTTPQRDAQGRWSIRADGMLRGQPARLQARVSIVQGVLIQQTVLAPQAKWNPDMANYFFENFRLLPN